MQRKTEPLRAIAFETSARRDLRPWGLFLIGLVFMYAGFTIDPASNCSEDGECAPWLVPLAAGLGILATLGGLGQLLNNPARGSRLDADANRLDWWQNRLPGTPGDSGTIALDQIERIRIKRDSDSDEISLYDRQGQRLPFFDREVIQGSPERWAERARAVAPGIGLEIVD